MKLETTGLTLAYGKRAVVHELDLAVPEGRISAIVGANASGKSTLLRSMARLMSPAAGAVLLDGEEVHRLPTRVLARKLGLLAQSPVSPDGLTVGGLVERGRFPHRRLLVPPTAEDREKVEWALAVTETIELRDRPLDELSGGQRQRAWVAMALAQDPAVLLLDEPTTYLDLAHQLEVLDLLRELNRMDGRTVVLVLHDINQAARYADHLVALRAGRTYAAGPPSEILDAELVKAVLNVDAQVIPDPVSGTPMLVPISRQDTDRLRQSSQIR